jgi:hypothetical protein
MKKQLLLKTIGNGLIILIVTVLTYKFIMWNSWKVDQAVTQVKKVLAAPPALNLTLSNDNTVLFQKSFANNVKNNYYIINHFDLTPYIRQIDNNKGSRFPLQLSINDGSKKNQLLRLHCFKTFNMVTVNGYHFVFTTSNCEIEDFLKIKECLPFIIRELFREGIAEEISGCDSIMNELVASWNFPDSAAK